MEYREEMSLNKDFSGTIYMNFIFQNFLLEGDNSNKLDRELEELKEKAKNYKGIQIVFIKKEPLASKTSYKIKIRFSDLKTLEKFLNEESSSSRGTNSRKSMYNFRLVELDNYLKFERVIRINDDTQAYSDEEEALLQNLTQLILTNYLWKFKITFPYKVLDTNGILLEDNKTVEWTFDLYTLSKKPVKMEVLMEKPSLLKKIINFLKNLFK
jgi:hypothetical protein